MANLSEIQGEYSNVLRLLREAECVDTSLSADLIEIWPVHSSSIPLILPHIVVVGAQNVGKSSIIEAISTVSKL